MINMTLERTYTIPLRKEFLKVPKYKRTKKAVTAVREFIQKHMKSDDVLIGPKLNLKLWERGIRSPPHHVKVNAVKDEKTKTVRVELFGFEFKPKEKKEKTPKASGLAGKLQEKLGGKEKEEPAEKTKVTTKKDIKEKKVGLKKTEHNTENNTEHKPE
jgi:large subunit ribosomal protein L31e